MSTRSRSGRPADSRLPCRYFWEFAGVGEVLQACDWLVASQGDAAVVV